MLGAPKKSRAHLSAAFEDEPGQTASGFEAGFFALVEGLDYPDPAGPQ
jgi:hypothetical protein